MISGTSEDRDNVTDIVTNFVGVRANDVEYLVRFEFLSPDPGIRASCPRILGGIRRNVDVYALWPDCWLVCLRWRELDGWLRQASFLQEDRIEDLIQAIDKSAVRSEICGELQ